MANNINAQPTEARNPMSYSEILGCNGDSVWVMRSDCGKNEPRCSQADVSVSYESGIVTFFDAGNEEIVKVPLMVNLDVVLADRGILIFPMSFCVAYNWKNGGNF